VPHLTTAIQDWIEKVAHHPVDDAQTTPEVCIVELGGTVGDIESAPFVEALRQFQFRVGKENFALIHVSLVPVVGGEQKTKPTQAAIRDLRGLGLVPDMVAARCIEPLERSVISKLSMFCHVEAEQVLGVHDVSSTYHVPLLLEKQGMVRFLEKRLNLDIKATVSSAMQSKGADLRTRWRELTVGHDRLLDKVEIVLVGKYTSLQDSYMSVVKALEHCALRVHRKLVLKWVEAGDLEASTQHDNPVRYHEAWHSVCSATGILIPGGFGVRGTEGMISAAKWAREHRVPFLGICLGFQVAVVEFARNVCGIEGAGSAELDPECPDPVVIYMPEISKTHLGGTMRLGLRPSLFQKDSGKWSKIRKLYGGAETVWERHRHRYEINPEYIERIERGNPESKAEHMKQNGARPSTPVNKALRSLPTSPSLQQYDGFSNGYTDMHTVAQSSFDKLSFVGRSESGERMQIAELVTADGHEPHPYFVGMQAHPEFASRPLNPSPPFLGFIAAAAGGKEMLEEQIARQANFVPPHPPSLMVLESEREDKEASKPASTPPGAVSPKATRGDNLHV
jgi:CTP synthase